MNTRTNLKESRQTTEYRSLKVTNKIIQIIGKVTAAIALAAVPVFLGFYFNKDYDYQVINEKTPDVYIVEKGWSWCKYGKEIEYLKHRDYIKIQKCISRFFKNKKLNRNYQMTCGDTIKFYVNKQNKVVKIDYYLKPENMNVRIKAHKKNDLFITYRIRELIKEKNTTGITEKPSWQPDTIKLCDMKMDNIGKKKNLSNVLEKYCDKDKREIMQGMIKYGIDVNKINKTDKYGYLNDKDKNELIAFVYCHYENNGYETWYQWYKNEDGKNVDMILPYNTKPDMIIRNNIKDDKETMQAGIAEIDTIYENQIKYRKIGRGSNLSSILHKYCRNEYSNIINGMLNCKMNIDEINSTDKFGTYIDENKNELVVFVFCHYDYKGRQNWFQWYKTKKGKCKSEKLPFNQKPKKIVRL